MREYLGESNLNIDGRCIPYQLFTAEYYLSVKHNLSEERLEDFVQSHPNLVKRINQVIALKQACVLLRHTSHSDGSLAEDLYSLKNELIHKILADHDYLFDEELMENYPDKETYKCI